MYTADVCKTWFYLSKGKRLLYIINLSLSQTHTHIHNGILAIKKNEVSPFVTTWMDLEGIILSEICETEKDKYCMISIICGRQTHR